MQVVGAVSVPMAGDERDQGFSVKRVSAGSALKTQSGDVQ
jgi:hypothetical protein